MNKQRRRFVPSFDILENRWVPAGNVYVTVHHHILEIYGDAQAQQISVVGSGENVTVTALDSDTTINGHSTPLTVSGVTKGVKVWMGLGDDVLNISGISVRKMFNVDMGSGNDTLTVDNIHARKSEINGLDGDDSITVKNTSIRRSLFIDGGSGTDSLTTTGNSTRSNDFVNFENTSANTPVANNDTATVNQGSNVTINVATNDTTPTGTIDLTTIAITQQPTHGTLTVNNDGTVKYTNDGSANTSDTFKYTIKNSNGTVSNAGTVTITINPVSQSPVAGNDTATVAEGGNVNISIFANDTDADGTLDFTTVVITQQPSHGTLTNNNNGTFKYTHNGSDTPLTDTFKYTVKDNNGNVSNEATVTITITPVNDPPVANNDSDTVAEGGNVTTNVAGNDTDTDGTINLTTIVITQQPTHGTLTVNTNGTVKYTHDGSETTTDTYKYTIKDNGGATSNAATVTITITPVNDAPVANNDSATLSQGGIKKINLAGNDTDAEGALDLTSISITAAPSHGTLKVNGDGTVTYTHDGSATTSDTFKYKIKDVPGLFSNEAVVNITLTTGNTAPVANNDIASLANGASTIINVTSNDADSDGTLDLTTLVITTPPTNGSVIVNGDGTITYTHNGSATTSDTFSYTIRDNLGLTSNIATVSITIT